MSYDIYFEPLVVAFHFSRLARQSGKRIPIKILI